MATSSTAKSSPTVAPAVAKSIQSQINSIQAGINSIKSGGSSSPSQGGAVVKGRIVGAGGVDLGAANPADAPGAGSPRLSPTLPTAPQITPQAGIEPLKPTDQVPQELANQVTQAQTNVNQLASSKGLTLKPTPTGSFSAVPDESALRQQAHQALTASGVPASPQAGVGSAIVQSALKNFAPQSESPSILGPIQETDSMFDKLFTDYDDYFSPPVQRTSLLDEYSKLSGSLGIESLNHELIDTKRIIDGTEDDIRSEITAAGGTATESQVMAMSNSRNKQLIKNYNYLLDTKNAATTQLQTMMQLSIQDRQFAEAEFTRKLNFGMQVAQFQQTATQNARTTYLSLIEKGMGASMLTDPYQTGLVEKTLGIPRGGLTNVVAQQAQKSSLETRQAEANLAKTYAEIAKLKDDGAVVTDINGRVVLKPQEALKISKEVASSDPYKAIQKGKDSLQFLKKFEETFAGTGATSAVFSPRDNAKLKAEYNAAILNLKEFFNLGVLNGPDEAILKSVLPDPTNRSAVLTTLTGGVYKPSAATQSGINNMKAMIEQSLDSRYQTLNSQFGDYSPQSVGALDDLDRTYIEQKATLNPNITQMLKDHPELSMEDIISILTR